MYTYPEALSRQTQQCCCAGQEEGSRGSGRDGCACPPLPDGTPSAVGMEEKMVARAHVFTGYVFLWLGRT